MILFLGKIIFKDIGIDTLNLYKSCNRPILGHVVGFPVSEPFILACSSGINNPVNVNDFIREFCENINFEN